MDTALSLAVFVCLVSASVAFPAGFMGKGFAPIGPFGYGGIAAGFAPMKPPMMPMPAMAPPAPIIQKIVVPAAPQQTIVTQPAVVQPQVIAPQPIRGGVGLGGNIVLGGSQTAPLMVVNNPATGLPGSTVVGNNLINVAGPAVGGRPVTIAGGGVGLGRTIVSGGVGLGSTIVSGGVGLGSNIAGGGVGLGSTIVNGGVGLGSNIVNGATNVRVVPPGYPANAVVGNGVVAGAGPAGGSVDADITTLSNGQLVVQLNRDRPDVDVVRRVVRPFGASPAVVYSSPAGPSSSVPTQSFFVRAGDTNDSS